jgi:hypothetical protein
MIDRMTSGYIVGLLEKKHELDVFVPECKNGETWGVRDLLKLDAWVLRRTYSPLTIIGYEIKVSRSDFVQDQKWMDYLELCHAFYFVCPAGMIRATDLPSGVGIIWVSKSGTLHTKRKAVRHEFDPTKLLRLLVYVVMARSIITDNGHAVNRTEASEPMDRVKAMEEFLVRAEENKQLAHLVRGHVRRAWENIGKREQEIDRKVQRVATFEERLTKLGITWDSNKTSWNDDRQIESEIDLLKSRISDEILREMEHLGRDMIETAEMIKKMRSGGG